VRRLDNQSRDISVFLVVHSHLPVAASAIMLIVVPSD
jgi:hypothetical protein